MDISTSWNSSNYAGKVSNEIQRRRNTKSCTLIMYHIWLTTCFNTHFSALEPVWNQNKQKVTKFNTLKMFLRKSYVSQVGEWMSKPRNSCGSQTNVTNVSALPPSGWFSSLMTGDVRVMVHVVCGSSGVSVTAVTTTAASSTHIFTAYFSSQTACKYHFFESEECQYIV